MITFRSYNKQELAALICSDLYHRLENVPVSVHRAISQSNNPFASENDVLLWAAFDGDYLAGYVGVLPDEIHVQHKAKKIYWLSCFWVNDVYKNANLSSQLFFAVLKQYKDQLFITNFLLNLENTYQSLGVFQATQFKYGMQFYIYPDFYPLLKAKWGENFRITKIFGAVQKLLFWNVKFHLDVNRSLFKKKTGKVYVFKTVSNWDAELSAFQSDFMQKYPFNRRNAEYFQWVLSNPWVVNELSHTQPEKYYFSSYAPDFENIIVKMYKNDILCGWTLLVIKNNSITLKYLFSKDENFKELTTYILNLSLNKNIYSIISYDDRINKFYRNENIFFCFKKKIKKAYLFPKNAEISHNIFQEGDGDSVFT